MKVLVVSGAFPPTPLAEANHALHLATALAQLGAQVDVLTTRGGVTEGFPFRVHAEMPGWTWRDAPRFARLLRRLSPDAILFIYIGFAYDDHPMTTFAPTMAKAALPRVRFVTQFENAMGVAPHRSTLGSRIIRKLATMWAGTPGVDWEFGTLLRDSDRVIVLGAQHEAQLAEHSPGLAEKSVLIPPPPIIRVVPSADGTARHSGRKRIGAGPDEFVLTYFGYLYPNKGLETLLQAFHTVRQHGKAGRLVIAGGVPSHLRDERLSYVRGLEVLATDLGIQKDIVWTGLLDWDTDDASLILHASDACVLPFDIGVSMNNSTFAAAAAHELPVITTRGSLVESPFRHEENVLLCPPRDAPALAAAIETLMAHPEVRARLSRGIHEMYLEWFSWERAGEKILAALGPG